MGALALPRSESFTAAALVLRGARQDLATDHQERGRDSLFGSGRVGGWHDHRQENAPKEWTDGKR